MLREAVQALIKDKTDTLPNQLDLTIIENRFFFLLNKGFIFSKRKKKSKFCLPHRLDSSFQQ